jgi:hypothetical protein
MKTTTLDRIMFVAVAILAAAVIAIIVLGCSAAADTDTGGSPADAGPDADGGVDSGVDTDTDTGDAGSDAGPDPFPPCEDECVGLGECNSAGGSIHAWFSCPDGEVCCGFPASDSGV